MSAGIGEVGRLGPRRHSDVAVHRKSSGVASMGPLNATVPFELIGTESVASSTLAVLVLVSAVPGLLLALAVGGPRADLAPAGSERSRHEGPCPDRGFRTIMGPGRQFASRGEGERR